MWMVDLLVFLQLIWLFALQTHLYHAVLHANRQMHSFQVLEYDAGTAQAFYFDQVYGLNNQTFVGEISDHYPVFAQYKTNLIDDDWKNDLGM